MADLHSVCVYCGSAPGHDPVFSDAARSLGTALARENLRLVYGGGSGGLMGTVAGAVIEAGGHVTGIMPQFLKDREQLLARVDDVVIVPDMHTRKRIMFERADAFVALPGGVGTLEELVEQMTWVQLGRHTKPVLIADVAGFWSPFLTLLDHMRGAGFIRTAAEVRPLVTTRIEDVVPALRAAVAAVGAPALDVEPGLA